MGIVKYLDSCEALKKYLALYSRQSSNLLYFRIHEVVFYVFVECEDIKLLV